MTGIEERTGMLERIGIDAAVRALRPDVAVLAISAEGLSNGPSDALTQDLSLIHI